MVAKQVKRENRESKPKSSSASFELSEESFGVRSFLIDDRPDVGPGAVVAKNVSFVPSQTSPSHPAKLLNSPEGKCTKVDDKEENTPHMDGGGLADTILQILLTNTASLNQAVESFFLVYKQKGPASALCAILNIIAKASAVAEVELDAVAFTEGIDITSLLDELYMRVPEDGAAYYLANKDAKYRRFRRTFPVFFQTLTRLAFSNDVLLDDCFLPTLAQWLIGMSESKLRSFRHTATIAILNLLQGFNELITQLQNRDLRKNCKKELNQVEKKLKSLVQWRDLFFSQAIHQRLRDIAVEIRLSAAQHLKEWVWKFPSEYMTNKYLRYFGMALHDPQPELRIEGLDMILQAVARVSDGYSRMHLFLQYFAARLVEMSNDIDVRCTELAIRVVAIIVHTDSSAPEGNQLFNNEMIDRVLLALFDERPTVRRAAGVLLKAFIHCRTASESTESDQMQAAIELLCCFIKTLRTHRERMPERYLVDALWSPDHPPLILTTYEPLLKRINQSSSPLDIVVSLRLLTSLIERINGKVKLGPIPKDDRRHAAHGKKLSGEVQKSAEQLVRNISDGVALVLCDSMVRYCDDLEVLSAVADAISVLDLSMFTSRRHISALSDFILELRKATSRLIISTVIFGLDNAYDSLVHAWHALTFTVNPLQSIAQGHLQELRNEILKQLTWTENATSSQTKQQIKEREENLIAVWGRFSLIASLVSTCDDWVHIERMLGRQLQQEILVDVTWLRLSAFATDAAMNYLLLQISKQHESHESLSMPQITERVTELVKFFFQILTVLDAGLSHQVENESTAQGLLGTDADRRAPSLSRESLLIHLRVQVLLYLCDLLALSYCDVSMKDQFNLVKRFEEVFQALCTRLRDAQEHLKITMNTCTNDDKIGVLPMAEARHQCLHLEATQMRLVGAICRLFVFKRLGVGFAPRVLTQWTVSSSKPVSDIFKSLFYVLRSMAAGSFEIERDILTEAYNRCAEVGATPISVDALHQIGTKLASMHFFVADRHYSACKEIIQFAMNFASTTDPLILEAVIPYCSKLRVVDAVQLHNNLLESNFFTNIVNSHVHAFMTSLCRAAKLESTPLASLSRSVKRPREVTTLQPHKDDLLASIAQGFHFGPTLDNSSGAQQSFLPPLARTNDTASAATAASGDEVSVVMQATANEGWYRPAELQNSQQAEDVFVALSPEDEERTKVEDQQRCRPVVSISTTQEVTVPGPCRGIDTEIFIATSEFE